MTAPPLWLAPELTALAFCWRLDRKDGVTLGFTSHDHDLERDGLVYRASPGLVPSAIELTDDFEAGSVDLKGMLTNDAIRAEDLAAGRWDGARLSLFATDWSDEGAQSLPLIDGHLGMVSQAGEAFTAELRGRVAAMDVPLTESTSPHCRARLGDPRCRVDLAGRRLVIPVASVSDAVIQSGLTLEAGAYAYGRLRWLDGANAGLEALVLANDAGSMTLAEAPRLLVQPGDMAELTQGCDRRLDTCRTRFANVLNFRGEPHLPGNDLLTRYAL